MQAQTIPPLWFYQIIRIKDLVFPLKIFGKFLVQLDAALILMRLILRMNIELELKSQSRTAQIAFGYLGPGVLLNSGLCLLL